MGLERNVDMRKRNIFTLLGIMLLIFSLSSCKEESIDFNPYKKNIVDNGEIKLDGSMKKVEDYKKSITSEFTITTGEGSYQKDIDSNGETIYTLKESGSYDLMGLLDGGRILIDDPALDINLNLMGVKIVSKYNSPIFAKQAKSLKVKVMEESYNEIFDERSPKISDEESLGEASIYAKADLKVTGKGALYLYGNYNNAIATTDDLYFKNIVLKAVGRNNAVKGNDSITVESGDITAIALSGDGFKTDNSDISSKGIQFGSVNLLGGNISILAKCDGIDSAFDVTIEPYTYLDIETNSLSLKYEVELPIEKVFIKTEYENYRFSLYDRVEETFYDSTYLFKKKNPRTGKNEFYYSIDAKIITPNHDLYMFESNKEDSKDEYVAKTNGNALDLNQDLISIDLVKDKVIQASSMIFAYSNHQFSELKSSSESNKGIKASNIITINGGTLDIVSADDGIHANSSRHIESLSKKGKGDIVINGGFITINSLGDSIHADGNFTLNRGNLELYSNDEGLEGNLININGGSLNIVASDDSINASGNMYKPLINITGGYIEVDSLASDSDTIDSNGDYLQSGGVIILKNKSHSEKLNSFGLDIDGKAKITGGTFINIGGKEDIKADINSCLVKSSLAIGTYKVSNTDIEFKLTTPCEYLLIVSDQFVTNQTYKLVSESNILGWTQDSGNSIVGE